MALAAQGCVAGSEARPPKSTVHDYLMLWEFDGTLERMHHELYVKTRDLEGPVPHANGLQANETFRSKRSRHASDRVCSANVKKPPGR